jgi:excisionase family DNA binding protein
MTAADFEGSRPMSDRLATALADLVEALRDEVRAETASSAASPDRLLSVDEAAALLGIGRSRLYDEIAALRVRSVKVGRRRLVPSGAIAEFIAGARR